MRDAPENRHVHRLRWIAAALLLLLAAMLIAPFLLTTPLVRLALGQVFPAGHLSLGRAALSPWGTLVLYDLRLHETTALAQQPLVSARRVDAAFGWAALLSRQIRRIHADGVIVYARPNSPPPFWLLDLLSERSTSSPPTPSTRGTPPIWIDTLNVQGIIHLEPHKGLVLDRVDWPLAFHMTMSGDRMDPSRQIRIAIGKTLQVPEAVPEKTSIAAPEPVPSAEAAFGLLTDLETQPAAAGTRVVVHRLVASQAALTIEADILRRYTTTLPTDLHGPIAVDLGALDVSGVISPGRGGVMGLRGHIRRQDLSLRSPAGSKHLFALDRFSAVASVESQLRSWVPESLKVRDGVMQWETLSYNNNAVNNLDASWRLDSQTLMIDRFMAQIFDGHMSGLLAWDLDTHAMPQCDIQMQSINMHAVLANISPEHLDTEGSASGFLHLVLSAEGELSGTLDLAFDGPGILRIGEIEEVERMLVGNVGLALATRALHDLQQYPFKEGRLHLKSLGQHSELQITLVRQPRDETDVTPPHQEIINGQEVLVGSVVVPTIDLTVPITGKSLAEILSIVSGLRPLHEGVSEPQEK